jgi:broad specificity phosphatase PhoE
MTPTASRPKRIVLIRHGESEGNIDPSLYERVPDHALRLTERGRKQCEEAGRELRALFGAEHVTAFVSPYTRTRETFRLLGLDPASTRVKEEPRLREQDWGNLQQLGDMDQQKAERDAYGHFFYRLAHGESGADVYDRVSAFLETLHRDFARHAERYGPDRNILLVTHGLTMRLFCMRWFHWSVEQFECLSNPANGETRILLRGDDGRYTLDRPFERWK